MRHIIQISLIIAISAVNLACTTIQDVHLYDGPALAPENSAKVTLPLELEITELDNRLINQGMQRFRNDTLNVFFPPGEHKLVVHYESLWDLDGENHEKVRSQPILFEFNSQAGEIFHFEYEKPKTLKQAQTFAQSIPITLVSQQRRVSGFGLKKQDPLTFHQKEAPVKVDYPHLQQLEYWWQQATPYERKQFRQWINRSEIP